MTKAAEGLRKFLRGLPRGSLAAAAKAKGISPPVLYRLASDEVDQDPRLSTLDMLADALSEIGVKTTPADLLGGVTPPPAVEVLQRELRAAQDEILRLKVELAEARAKPRPASDPPEVEFLRSLPPTDPLWEILRGMMEDKGKGDKKAK